MLGESFGDHFAQPVVFLAAEEAQTASAFLSLANEPSWIDGYLAVANPFPIAERDKCLVVVGCRRRFAVLTEPALQFLRRHFSSMTGSHVLTDNGRFALIVTMVLVIRNKLQSIVNQATHRYHFTVAQLR